MALPALLPRLGAGSSREFSAGWLMRTRKRRPWDRRRSLESSYSVLNSCVRGTIVRAFNRLSLRSIADRSETGSLISISRFEWLGFIGFMDISIRLRLLLRSFTGRFAFYDGGEPKMRRPKF